MPTLVKNRKAFVLGATGVIGSSIALKLAQNHYDLVLHGTNEAKLNALKTKVKNYTENVQCVKCIFCHKTPDIFLTNDIKKSLLASDILCVCVGPFLQKVLHETSYDDWQLLSYFNLTLPCTLVSMVLCSMVNRGYGRIVLFGGTKTDMPRAFLTNAAYASVKSSLNTLAKSVAKSYGKQNVTCNVILPGFVKESLKDSSNFFHRTVDACAIAETVLFLINTPEINGVALPIDSGFER